MAAAKKALPPQFRKKGPVEAKEPRAEERREAKMPPKARAAVEAREAAGAPMLPGYKRGGRVKKC